MNNLKDILGYCLIIMSLFDAWKYIWQAQAIKRIKIAKGHSRKFINVALCNDLIKITYGINIKDNFIILSSLCALITMSYNFYILYLYYPYRMRGILNFKKPNIVIYLINSWLPNKLRKRL